ncbi:MAG: hypothetical protein LAO31_19905 [Acidobacteriia bacterium]|nr:hypothetical protein [Terriglobia bacterium]
MHTNQYAIIFYIFFWVVRINGCVRRGRQPLLRGPGWFFNVAVQPDFYTGAGRTILHRYWMRMFIPFAVDVPLAIAIFLSGHLLLLNWLILGACALIHINHSFSVDLAERQARPLAVPEAEQPVASIVLSLKPRRLRDYTNRKVEWALALSSLVALACLVRYYFAAPEHHNLRLVFGVPAFFLYLQAGMLFVKRVVVAWRTPVPQVQAEEHMEAREETRKYYLRTCDWCRAAAAAGILFWPIAISTPPTGFNRVFGIWFAAWMMIAVVATIWVEIRRKQLVKLALRARPVKLPDFLHQSEIARWPVCYQPSAPMLLLKGARGYSLNLANTLTHLGAAYLAGLIALFALLPKGP